MPGPGAYDDTGAWVLKASLDAGLQGMEVYIDDYMVHFGSASWGKEHSKGRAQASWLETYKSLWQ